MKQIGEYAPYLLGGSNQWIKPAIEGAGVKIFIPEDAENVSTNHYEHIGWILPVDASAQGGGKIYKTHEHAGTRGVAAYVRRVPTDPMNVTRSEFDTIVKLVKEQQERIAKLERHWNIKSDDTSARLTLEGQPFDPMTFYDHAFIAAYMAERYHPDAVGTIDKVIIRNAHSIAAMLTVNRADPAVSDKI